MTSRKTVAALTMRVLSVFLTVAVLGTVQRVEAHPQDLLLVNNGYEGLVVSISDSVSQEHCNHVIHGLKASRFSYVPFTLTLSPKLIN
ncbi:hypothetical protein E2C01_087763 [Portunus trituberculatus]|uniref:Uncharacterized protein n=1 Tax=Portunus trituberculatus TaxID=210409 RepID=A0A5B7J7H3_PORTR|nr:hypothetical protein [Portunus trituberculatus]